jgi:hypothetical protein
MPGLAGQPQLTRGHVEGNGGSHGSLAIAAVMRSYFADSSELSHFRVWRAFRGCRFLWGFGHTGPSYIPIYGSMGMSADL